MKLNPWPLPLWIAHRGAGKLAPENTLAAFRVGASHGYRAFECDVKLSSDGVPFLLHDTTLDRTTPERGVAGQRLWHELSQLDAGGWHSPTYAGEPLPSLNSIARYVQRNGFGLNIEIKPTPGLERETGEAVGSACLSLWSRTDAPLVLSSFNPGALQGAMHSAAAIPRALLLDKPWPGWQTAAQQLACVAVVTNYKVMNQALISELHQAGLHGLCYTVNDAAEAHRLLALSISGIITDAVDKFSPQANPVDD